MSWTLVTGGARRLGAEICKTLAAKGHNILVHYNTSLHEADQVVTACKKMGVCAESIQGDFSSPITTEEFIKNLLERFSSIDNLINNVGNYNSSTALHTSAEEWDALFQVNLHAPFRIILALIPSIKRQKGSILNIGVAGIDNMRSARLTAAYSATKVALLSLTKSLARELAPDHVRVNMISPGQLENSIDKPDPMKLPMQRMGTTSEVSRVIAFLLEKENSYITGQNIEIAGGVGL